MNEGSLRTCDSGHGIYDPPTVENINFTASVCNSNILRLLVPVLMFIACDNDIVCDIYDTVIVAFVYVSLVFP